MLLPDTVASVLTPFPESAKLSISTPVEDLGSIVIVTGKTSFVQLSLTFQLPVKLDLGSVGLGVGSVFVQEEWMNADRQIKIMEERRRSFFINLD